jgi:polysaccharide export outer membrane protein
MRSNRKSVLVLMLAMTTVVVGGCAIAPGMTMNEPAELPEGKVVEIQPLTMELLSQLEAEYETRVREVAQEFGAGHTEYLIGRGDVIQVIVWDHPELTIPAGSFRDAETSGQQVNEDGYMFYPYVGLIKAEGMNITELRAELTERISDYIQDPQLDVRVIGFRSKRIYVVGEVNTPGVLPLNDLPMTIADAISLSGGLTENAFNSGVNVSRDGQVYAIDLRALYEFADASQNLMLRHGDIVNVLDRSQQKVFVMGEVNRPGSVEIINGTLNLAAALGEVGGVRQISANPGAIFVIRGADTDDPRVFHLDAEFATGMLLAERFEMRAQDVVFVDTAGVSQWNRVISQLLPSISVIGIVDNVAQ